MSKLQHRTHVKLFLPALAVVSLTTILFGNVKPAQATSACPDVEVIFIHGAASDIDDSQDVTAWRSAFQSQDFGRLAVDYYNLGESDRYGARYNGADIGASSLTELKNTVETFLTAGDTGEFNATVKDALTELSGRVQDVLTTCPDTKFVFGGYSEGAYTLHKFFKAAAPELGLTAENVLYVATFGDPKLYLPEGEGINPPACRNQDFSSYRVYTPNCRAHSGILGAEQPDYFPTSYLDQAGLWCTKRDVMCSNYFDPFNLSHILDDHLAYAENAPYPYKQAAILVRQKLAALFPDKISSGDETVHSAARDTAILIDATGSMAKNIEKYRTEALKIAKTTLESGGRIALYAYRDLKADGKAYVPQKLCDFSCTYAKFEHSINNLKVSGGGDTPESALAASLGVMNQLEWQKGATKSIVLLTDATYHDTDFDGTTLSDVVKRSLEIDPVNFYVVTTDSVKPSYDQLVSATGGQSFSLSAADIALSGQTLLNRPDLNFQFESYASTTAEATTFLINTSATDVDHFEWDLDLDGVFEMTTTSPTISYLYTAPTAGFVQAKVVTTSGYTSTASALLTVSYEDDALGEAPTIENLEVEVSDTTAKATFETSDDTAASIVILDDYILALTKDEEITITDLPAAEHTITVAPVSNSGLRGTPTSKTFTVETETVIARATSPAIPKAPNTGSPRR